VSILHLVQWLPKTDSKLCENSNCFKHSLVLVTIMAEDFLQSCKLFEALVHGLMPGTHIVLELFDDFTVKVIWNDDSRMLLPSISKVSLRLLPCLLQLLLQSISKDVDVRPGATRKGSVDPNDVASYDAHRHLVPVTRAFELVGIPVPPWMLLWQAKISSINRYLASLAGIADVPVGPEDLHRSIERSREGNMKAVSDNTEQ